MLIQKPSHLPEHNSIDPESGPNGFDTDHSWQWPLWPGFISPG